MADFKLFADIVPDFSRMKKDAKKEKIEVGVDGDSLDVGGGEESEEQTSIMGGMLGKLGAIAGVIGVLLQLETITGLLQIIIGFINLGVVTLIKFIGSIISFLADLPSKIGELAMKVWNFISGALMDFLSKIPIIGGAFQDEEQGQGLLDSVRDTAFGIASGNSRIMAGGVTGLFNNIRGGEYGIGRGSEPRQEVDVKVSADPTDRFFELTASVVEGASRFLFS